MPRFFSVPSTAKKFQSSPSPKTGRYLAIVLYLCSLILFQSSPSPKTGRYFLRGKWSASLSFGSNPHPVRKLGAMVVCWGCVCLLPFQSSPSPKTGRYSRIPTMQGGYREFQSSPSPKTGRYLVSLIGLAANETVPILTQSENWAL